MKQETSLIAHQSHDLRPHEYIRSELLCCISEAGGVYGTDSILEPASSVQSMNFSFSHFSVGWFHEREREVAAWVKPHPYELTDRHQPKHTRSIHNTTDKQP